MSNEIKIEKLSVDKEADKIMKMRNQMETESCNLSSDMTPASITKYTGRGKQFQVEFKKVNTFKDDVKTQIRQQEMRTNSQCLKMFSAPNLDEIPIDEFSQKNQKF